MTTLRGLWRVWRAYWFAARAHRGQVDKAGQPYIRHLRRVAWVAYGLTGDLEAAVVGLLHDYVEDVEPKGGAARLLRKFGSNTMIRIMLLSRHQNQMYQTYEDYVLQIARSGDGISVAVKIADLLHNTDASRRQPMEPWLPRRRERYLASLKILIRERAEWVVER